MTLLESWRIPPALTDTAGKALTPLLLAGGAVALTYAGICLTLYSYQKKLIYRPLPDIIKTPADTGLAYENVWIPLSQNNTADAASQSIEKLHAWWVPSPGSRRVMLFCHGNYGNISYNTERIRFHHSQGCSVLAFDYRGYGQSSGPSPNEKNTFADTEAAWQYLITQRRIKPEHITVCGHSIGGAIAIELGSKHPEIDRLIVESSFTRMRDAVIAKNIYRAFPIEQLLTEPFDSLSKVKNLTMPVLYVHGDQDFDVPTNFSKQLYAATPNPKQLFIALGADHNIDTLAGPTYAAVLQDFYRLNQSVAQLQSA